MVPSRHELKLAQKHLDYFSSQNDWFAPPKQYSLTKVR